MEHLSSADLRAPSIPHKRFRTRSQKYYSFRGVNPGQLHQPHYRLFDDCETTSLLRPDVPMSHYNFRLSQDTKLNTTPVQVMTPRQLFTEAQCWPRPPRYHRRHRDKLHKQGAITAYATRREGKRQMRRMLTKGEEWEGDEASGWGKAVWNL